LGTHKIKKQTDEKTLQNEMEVFDLRTKGWTQYKIAGHLSLSQAAVSKILKRVNQKYSKIFMENVRNVKNDQIAAYELIRQEAMDSWYKSKGIIKVVKNKAKGKFDEQGAQRTIGGDQTVEEKQLFGDTRYLEVAMKAMEHIRKILGIDKGDDDEDKDPIFGSIKVRLIGKDGVELKQNSTDEEED
jgi:predicted transcriptional regulator